MRSILNEGANGGFDEETLSTAIGTTLIPVVPGVAIDPAGKRSVLIQPPSAERRERSSNCPSGSLRRGIATERIALASLGSPTPNLT